MESQDWTPETCPLCMILGQPEICIKHPNSSTLNGSRLEVSPADLVCFIVRLFSEVSLAPSVSWMQIYSVFWGLFTQCPGLRSALNYWSVLINTIQWLPVHADREPAWVIQARQLTPTQIGCMRQVLLCGKCGTRLCSWRSQRSQFPPPALRSEFCCSRLLEVFQPLQKMGWFWQPHISSMTEVWLTSRVGHLVH